MNRVLAVRRLTLVVLGAFALVASAAGATPARQRVFELKPPGGFVKPMGVAVDQETGNVYVADSEANVVDVFGAGGGAPVGGGPSQIAGFNFAEAKVGVAVDNACYFHEPRLSGGACEAFDSSNGDLYVANAGAGVLDKLKLNTSTHEYEIVHEFPFEEVKGVAVDPRGNVYVADPNEEAVTVFNAAGVEVGKIAQGTVGGPAFIAADGLGDVYVGSERSGVVKVVVNAKYEVQSETVIGEGVQAIAVDSHADLFLDKGSSIVEDDSSGGLVESIAAELPNGSHGIAVNYETGAVYASNDEEGSAASVVVYVPVPPPPVVFTGVASEVALTSATVAGTIDPEESAVTACEVEYSVGSAEVPFGSSVPCASQPAGSGTSPVPVTATLAGLQPDTFYRYRLSATNAGGAGHGLEQAFATYPGVVGSAYASGVTSVAATLTGLIDAREVTPTYHFAYVDEADYRPECAECESEPAAAYALGGSFPALDSNASANAQDTVSQTVSGLRPGTVYHFALVVTNFGGGVSVGPDATFTTRPVVPPTLSTGGAEAVAQTAAVLTGTLDPEGLASTYRFEYGTSTGYGSSWPSIPIPAGSGDASQGVAVEVPSLQPATTYHYRLVASNEDGTSYGADRTFTTAGYPPSAIEEAPVLSARLGINPEPTATGSKGPNRNGKAEKKTTKRHGKHRKKSKRRKGLVKRSSRVCAPKERICQ